MTDELLIPRPYRVVDAIDESPGIRTLHVVPVDGALPTFLPAQVSMLGAFGVGEAAISISSGVDETDHHAYTIRNAGPISGALTATPIGGQITVRGPFGRPWPLADVGTSNLVVVGGGLGIAPLRAMLLAAISRRHRFDRLVFAYGAKTPDDLVYAGEYDAWQAAGLELHLTVDRAMSHHRTTAWDGAVGVVPALLGSAIDLDWSDTTVFVCGPDVMMHYSAQALLGLGVPADRIWLTLERNMQCGNALCGHCQLGPVIVCRDGPVANYAEVGRYHWIPEL